MRRRRRRGRQQLRGRQGARGTEGRHGDRRGRGRGQPDRVGRLRRGRLDRPEGRLGLGLRAADRLPGQRQDRQHVRRDGDADAHRPVRRRVGVRGRDPAPDRGRRRRPGQHGPDQELRGRVRGPEGPAVELGRRADVRRSARPRREPADVALRQGRSGAGLVGRGVRPRARPTRARSPPTTTRSTSPTRRSTSRPRNPTSGSTTSTSSTTSSSRPRSTCSSSSARSSASTGRTTRRSRPRSPAATRSSAPPGR